MPDYTIYIPERSLDGLASICMWMGLEFYMDGTRYLPLPCNRDFAYALLWGPKDRIIRRREEARRLEQWRYQLGLAMMPPSDQDAYWKAMFREVCQDATREAYRTGIFR